MSAEQFWQQFVEGMRQTSLLEYIAVFTGIASVFFSRIENILVYPIGIISTVIYVFLSFTGGLYAEAGLNVYYTVMSLFGWVMWLRKKPGGQKELHISKSSFKDWSIAMGFFLFMLVILIIILKNFTKSTVPVADSFASAAAYTGMLLMNKKKIEHWFWWIITNIISIPLFFIKGYTFTSVQFIILLALAISGWIVWARKIRT